MYKTKDFRKPSKFFIPNIVINISQNKVKAFSERDVLFIDIKSLVI